MTNQELKKIASDIRKKIVNMVYRGKSCHAGTSLSTADLLTVLYFKIMNHNPKNPSDPKRDRFILSKGHGCTALYATLATAGYFPEERLEDYLKDGSPFTGHVNHIGIPGVEMSTGSLGHGLPVAVGMALAAKRDGKSHRVFVILSDGEMDEGSTWEAILGAANFGLDNLIAIVDYNKIQSFGRVEEIMPLEPLVDKWEAFNWSVKEVNGHDYDDLIPALSELPFEKGKPSVILAHTVKGKGVSFMENKLEWHYLTPDEKQFAQAQRDLEPTHLT